MKKLISTFMMLFLTSSLFADSILTSTLTTEALGYAYPQTFKLTVKFSDPVIGFDLSELNIVNATAANLINTCNTTFTMSITPDFPGPITIFLPANKVKSLISGASNSASNKLNIMALNPILNPSGNFDLSLWTLILPIPLGDTGGAITIGSNTLQGHPEFNTGYTNPPYFYTNPTTGAIDFFAPLNGATTTNSVYPRSELSEQLPTFPHEWTLRTFTSNSLTASLLISQMPPSKKIVVGRIQDKGTVDDFGQIVASKSLVKIYYDLNQFDPNQNICNGCIYVRVRSVPAQERFLKTRTLAVNVPLNKLFIYKLTLLEDGTLTIKVDDKSTTFNIDISADNTTGWGAQAFFFRAGVYVQDNGPSDVIGAEASFFSLQIKHETKL